MSKGIIDGSPKYSKWSGQEMAAQSSTPKGYRYGLLQVGGSNYVAVARILGIFEPSAAAIKRMIREAKANNRLIDVSRHREVKSVLVMDTGDIVATFLSPDEVARRLGIVEERSVE
jgi:regulator of extracellular matrix RemA (YlzA/DUF370 family)